jgi:hypothetical protein
MNPTNETAPEIQTQGHTATTQGHDGEAPAVEACHHMGNYITRMADGSLTGPARLYTRFHVATCPKCAAALRGLQEAAKCD